MKTIIETIKNLDKQTAKDLKLIAEMSANNMREFPEEEQEKLWEIIDMIITTTKNRVKELAEKELEII